MNKLFLNDFSFNNVKFTRSLYLFAVLCFLGKSICRNGLTNLELCC